MNISRRDFVVKSTLALAAMPYGCTTVEASNLPGHHFAISEGVNEPAKICLFSKVLQELSYDKMIPLVESMGFDGIDLTVRKNGHILPENVQRDLPLAVAAAKRSGVQILMLTTDINNVDDPFTESIISTAAASGITQYRMGRQFYDAKKTITKNLAYFAVAFKKLAKLNKKYQVRGEYQNHSGGGFGAPVWDLWEVLKNLDPAWIGVQYDLFHAVIEGANSWPLAFDLLKPYIGTVDIKDFYWKKENGKWDQQLTALGDGMVDYKQLITLLKKGNKQPIFSIHCEYLQEQDSLQFKMQNIQQDLATLKRWLT